MGCVAGSRIGFSAASNPFSTIGAASFGSQRPTGSSSPTKPSSTSCKAATEVRAFVQEAIQKRVSVVIGAGLPVPRTPTATSTLSPLGRRVAQANPGRPAAAMPSLSASRTRVSALIGRASRHRPPAALR